MGKSKAGVRTDALDLILAPQVDALCYAVTSMGRSLGSCGNRIAIYISGPSRLI